MNIEWILSSSVLILLIICIRFLFRKQIRPHVRYALWIVVAIRLLCPFSFAEAAFSVLNLLPGPELAAESRYEKPDGMMRQQEEAEMQAKSGTQAETEAQTGAGTQAETEAQTGAEAQTEAGMRTEAQMQTEAGMRTEAQTHAKPGTHAEAQIEVETYTEAEMQAKSGTHAEAEMQDTKAAPGEGEDGLAQAAHKISAADVLTLFRILYIAGGFLCAATLLTVNIHYHSRLKKCRRRIPRETLPFTIPIPVYVADIVRTPCLFGIVRPAVYVTKELMEDAKGEKKDLAFVLCHESTHYRHRDNWWAFVRIACICIHWYHPLVWLAAYLSRQDGELACDEKALALLGRESRVEYGRVLLKLSMEKPYGMSGFHISTTMRGSKRQLRERLQMILHMPEKRKGVLLLVAACMMPILGVTFTGGRSYSYAASYGILQVQWQAGKKEQTWGRAALYPMDSKAEDGGVLVMDLNFDGWDDLCFRGLEAEDGSIPYYCMLWQPEELKFMFNAVLYDVGISLEEQLLYEQGRSENGAHTVTYYRYDAEDRLHMVRYVEEPLSGDANSSGLDLQYIEEGSVYILEAVADDRHLPQTMIGMAKQALDELALWTGETVEKAYFQVSNMGGVTLAMTSDDMAHSRIFCSRYYGADTIYNLSGYEKSISSIDIASARSVWYSPVHWHDFPKGIEKMSAEETLIWYVERMPMLNGDKVREIEKNYEDMWTIRTDSGSFYEVVYNMALREVTSVYGPYPEYPKH